MRKTSLLICGMFASSVVLASPVKRLGPCCPGGCCPGEHLNSKAEVIAMKAKPGYIKQLLEEVAVYKKAQQCEKVKQA